MGFQVNEFTFNNYKYTNTYHRVGVLKRDKARKMMSIVIYIYKNKETRDQSPLNYFLLLTLKCDPVKFCSYFESNVNAELQCYNYLKHEINNFHGIDYTNSTIVFEEGQEELFNQYIQEQQQEEESEEE